MFSRGSGSGDRTLWYPSSCLVVSEEASSGPIVAHTAEVVDEEVAGT